MNSLQKLSKCICIVVLATILVLTANGAAPPSSGQSVYFPTVPAEHKHARALLENALALFAPANKMVDPVSGYPFEGWNHDPERGLFMRSFTQLTAIGLYMELLGNIVAGYADSPHLSRRGAQTQLTRLVKTLRQDQKNPQVSADGLLGNFLDLTQGKRLSSLTGEVDKYRFTDGLGREKGEAVWKALQAKGWIAPGTDDRTAVVHRGPRYGAMHFTDALAPYSDQATKEKIMAILDQRVVLTVFGDNANLSLSAAKTLGALLHPKIKHQPSVVVIQRELEEFLKAQKAGYTRLYDPKVGLFYFGRDASRDRLFGWVDLKGKWRAGHMDYLVNEFRSPATFVVLRYGLPVDALANLGFKIKPYRTQDGRDIYTLAPWDGSAFQVFGLNLSLLELQSPSWRRLLNNAVDIEIDFAARKKLPGFLSEGYTGEGARYTGEIGIPEISVTPKPRITDSPSLYTLGTAYSVAPEKVEKFLERNWPTISKLRTDHGPWEGYNVTRAEAIRIQTSAHTLSLILGMLGTGPENLKRYLDSQGLSKGLAELFKPGERVDFLSDSTRAFAWADKEDTIQTARNNGTFAVRGSACQVHIAFIPTRKEVVNLSGGLLRLRYRSETTEPVIIGLKPARPGNGAKGTIPTELFTSFVETGEEVKEIHIPLPAVPGLKAIKEVVLTYGQRKKGLPVDLLITHLSVVPVP